MRRVLVTGSAGFVGWHVTRAFADAYWEVLTLDIGDDFPTEPVDVVVSLAATADPAEALRDPAEAYANSTRVMVRTMEYARGVGAHVLHVSTNEAHPPVGPYGGAKACQEVICKTYSAEMVTIVVTQSLFGERQQPNKLVPTAVRLLLEGKPVQLQHDGKEYAKRPFLYVKDLAAALLILAYSTSAAPSVNIGAVSMMSTAEVVRTIARALGTKAQIEPVACGDRPGHELTVEPIGWDLDGWGPGASVRSTLKSVACWYRDNPEWLHPRTEAVA